jgi:hypothetical protein
MNIYPNLLRLVGISILFNHKKEVNITIKNNTIKFQILFKTWNN